MIWSNWSDCPDGVHQPGSCCDRVCVAHVPSEASDAHTHSCLLQTSSSYTPKHPQRSETPCTLHKSKGVFCACFLTWCHYPFFVLTSNFLTACSFGEELWDEKNPCKTTISAENEVEAQKLANNYKVNVSTYVQFHFAYCWCWCCSVLLIEVRIQEVEESCDRASLSAQVGHCEGAILWTKRY